MTDQLEFDWPGMPPATPQAFQEPARAQTPSPPPQRKIDYQAMHGRLELERELRTNSGIHFDLRITNNVSSLMSWRPGRNGNPAQFKLHHMFLQAESDVREALAQWVRQPRSKTAGALINRFIRKHMHLIEKKPAVLEDIRTEGQFHDLAALFQEVNREHFEDKVDTPIAWGRMATFSRQRSIQFGSYLPGQHLIRIHPLLDQEFVPKYFVRYIVFHEMLHAVLGIEENEQGRRSVHSPEFRRLEKAYPDYARATAWANDKAHFRRLLRPPDGLDRVRRILGIRKRRLP